MKAPANHSESTLAGEGRDRHVFVTEFLLSGKTIGTLLSQKKVKEAKWVIEYIRAGGPPGELAMTDPSRFTRLREAVTKHMLTGYY